MPLPAKFTWDKILFTSFLPRLKRPEREGRKKEKKKGEKITSVSLTVAFFLCFFLNPLAVPAWLQVSSQTISKEGARPAGWGASACHCTSAPCWSDATRGAPDPGVLAAGCVYWIWAQTTLLIGMKGTLIVALPVRACAVMHEKSWKTHTDVTVKCQENTGINERFKIKRDKENYFQHR